MSPSLVSQCRTSGIVASGVSHMNHEAVGVTGSSSWRKLFTTPARGMARYEVIFVRGCSSCVNLLPFSVCRSVSYLM